MYLYIYSHIKNAVNTTGYIGCMNMYKIFSNGPWGSRGSSGFIHKKTVRQFGRISLRYRPSDA